jgi:hypothetical protein
MLICPDGQEQYCKFMIDSGADLETRNVFGESTLDSDILKNVIDRNPKHFDQLSLNVLNFSLYCF